MSALSQKMALEMMGNSSACTNATVIDTACKAEGFFDLWLVQYCSLLVVCFASFKIAFFISTPPSQLPRGSGFLVVGLVAGLLGMVKNTQCQIVLFGETKVSTYFPANYVCMAFIAYATGAELVIEKYRCMMRAVSRSSLD